VSRGRFHVLCLSPHLDDVALSMAATVRAHVQRGQRVLIASLFTHAGPRDAGPFLRRDYPVRRAEDEAACKLMGASVIHGGLLDAPFRSASYRDLAGICFAHEKRERADQRQAEAFVRKIVEATRPTRVYAPLGVGEHVDHHLVHNAARKLKDAELWFYEDRPYSFVNHAVALRLETLGLARFETRCLPELRDSLKAAPMLAGMSAGDFAKVMQEFEAQHRKAPASKRRPARPVVRRFEVEAARLAQRVFECHASQVRGIVGGKGRYAKLALAYAKSFGTGYIERFWRV